MAKTSRIILTRIFIILLVSFSVYFNALFGDFIFDDWKQIVDNLWIRNISNIPTVFTSNVWGFHQQILTSNFYRPLMYVVYMLEYKLFGMKPWGFHLVNILFHCGASVLVFLLTRRMLGEVTLSLTLPLRQSLPWREGLARGIFISPSFIAALLFAVHPIHTEAVVWIAGLPDVAFTFFYLLSLCLYVLYREGQRRCYLLSVLSFSAAAFFKEPALTLPFILMAYDYAFSNSKLETRNSKLRYIPYFVVAGIYIFMRFYALRGFAPKDSFEHWSVYQLVINVFPLFGEYLTSLLLPVNLNFWRTFHPIWSIFEPRGAVSVAAAVAFLGIAAAAYRRHKELVFSLLLIVLPLLPVFYIKAIYGKPFAERYLYLSSAGYALLLGIFLSWIGRNLPRAVKAVSIILLMIIALYGIGTINRNSVWKDDITLWTDTVAKSPDSAVIHHHFGNAYLSKGMLDMAIREFRTALNMNLDYEETHNNLGNAYLFYGQFDMAAEQYRAALSLKPDYAEGRNNLGNAYLFMGLPDMAIEQYRIALSLKPDYAEAHNNLGYAYFATGQLDMAMEQYLAALRLKPDYAKAHLNLALVYLKKGDRDAARKEVEAALRLSPGLDEARRLLDEINSGRR